MAAVKQRANRTGDKLISRSPGDRQQSAAVSRRRADTTQGSRTASDSAVAIPLRSLGVIQGDYGKLIVVAEGYHVHPQVRNFTGPKEKVKADQKTKTLEQVPPACEGPTQC